MALIEGEAEGLRMLVEDEGDELLGELAAHSVRKGDVIGDVLGGNSCPFGSQRDWRVGISLRREESY